MKNKMSVVWVGTVLLVLSVGAYADDTTLEKVKDETHAAADKVDSEAHAAKRSVKHHARKTKTDIKNSTDDNEVRKAGRRANDVGNDALDKVEDTVHGH